MTARGEWAAEAVTEVRDDALRYLHASLYPRKLQAMHYLRWERHKHRLVDVARLMNPRRLAFHEIRLHYVVAVLETLCELAGKASGFYGRTEPIVCFTTPLLASWARKQFPMSTRTVRRALQVLAESELILYDPGRSRHPSLAGFPLMVDVDDSKRATSTLHAYEHDRPAWWAPMRLALLDATGDERAHALGDLRSELERFRTEDIEAQRAAIAEHTTDKPFVLGAIDVPRARKRAAQRERRCAQQLPRRPTPDKPRPDALQAPVSRGQNGRSCPHPDPASPCVSTDDRPIWHSAAGPEKRRATRARHSKKAVVDVWDIPDDEKRNAPSFAEIMATGRDEWLARRNPASQTDDENDGRAPDGEQAGMPLPSGPDGRLDIGGG